MILVGLLSFMLWAGEEIPTSYTPEQLAQKTHSLILIGETQDYCYANDRGKNCDRLLVYETDAELVHHMLVDRRASAKFNLNDVIKNPDGYSGPMESFNLNTEFSNTLPIQGVKTDFKPNDRIEITIQVETSEGQVEDLVKTIQGKRLYKESVGN